MQSLCLYPKCAPNILTEYFMFVKICKFQIYVIMVHTPLASQLAIAVSKQRKMQRLDLILISGKSKPLSAWNTL